MRIDGPPLGHHAGSPKVEVPFIHIIITARRSISPLLLLFLFIIILVLIIADIGKVKASGHIAPWAVTWLKPTILTFSLVDVG